MQKKKKIITTLLLAFCLTFFIGSSAFARVDENGETPKENWKDDKIEAEMKKNDNGVYSWNATLARHNGEWNKETFEDLAHNISEVYGGFAAWLWKAVCLGKGCHPNVNLSLAIQNLSKVNTETDLYEGYKIAYDALKIIGILLMLLYFLMDICGDLQFGDLSSNKFVGKLITLAVAIIVVDMGFTLFTNIVNVSNDLITTIGNVTARITTNVDGGVRDVYEQVFACGMPKSTITDIFGFLKPFQCLITFVLSDLINIVVELVVFIVVLINLLGRMLEIYIRLLFAPIGCASIVNGGMHSPGLRYIKRFASVLLQSVVIIGAYGAAKALTGNLFGMWDGWASALGALSSALVGLTLIGVLPKVDRIADEIIGV